jgi:hypothetical protein
LASLEELDKASESQNLCEEHWRERYCVENKLEVIYQKEGLYWQQRGSEKWITHEDANTEYFHARANGKRRKTRICSLETESSIIADQKAIRRHIVEFYKILFGSSISTNTHLAHGFWRHEERMGEEDKQRLVEHFSKK